MVRIENTKYLISSSGVVINEKTGLSLKPQDNGRGYKKITLTTKGLQLQRYVHRLVAMAYCNNPNGFKQVNHKDGDKSNNHFTNLEWVDSLMNIRHAISNDFFPKSTDYWNSKLTENQIRKILRLSKTKSGVYLSKQFNVSRGTISEIINGKRHKKIFGTELTIKP